VRSGENTKKKSERNSEVSGIIEGVYNKT